MIEGIDVSGGALDYEQVAAAKSFAYQKATDGVSMVSGQLITHCNGFRAAGMGDAIGVYHFLRVRHGRAQDADEQCKQFLDAQASAGAVLIPWLDIELGEPGSSNRAATKGEVKTAVLLFLETYEACTGTQRVAWYSSPGEALVLGLTLIDGLASYPLAVADYESVPHIIQPATSYSFWQYLGDQGVFGGVVDLVRFNGTVDDLKQV
jgi:GH25 family lysozyme M1 (1,4-beta-N-acetylmuramidase)